MTDQDLEQRLRAWYLVEIDDKASAPLQLRTENATLAQAAARSRRRFPVSWSFHRLNFFGPFALGGTAIAVALLIGIGLLLRPSPVVGPPASQRPTLSAAPSHVAPSSAPTPSGPLGGGLLIGAAGPDPVDGTFDVFTLDAGTGEQTLLGTLPRTGSHETYHFQWGADRKHVLITATDPGGRVALERATDAARDLIFVCCEPGAAGGVLSPQSDRIASYIEGSSAIPGCLLCVDATASVAIVEVVGGKRSTLPLPDGTVGGGSVSWSPDGSAVVVTGCRPCNNAGAVGASGQSATLGPSAFRPAKTSPPARGASSPPTTRSSTSAAGPIGTLDGSGEAPGISTRSSAGTTA